LHPILFISSCIFQRDIVGKNKKKRTTDDIPCAKNKSDTYVVVFSTNKTARHDITKISLKVALNTINQTIAELKDVTLIIVYESCSLLMIQAGCEILTPDY
jgi:hypothetical protein